LHFIHAYVVSKDYRVRIMLMFSEPEARTRALSWKLSLNIVQLGSKIHAATRATTGQANHVSREYCSL